MVIVWDLLDLRRGFQIKPEILLGGRGGIYIYGDEADGNAACTPLPALGDASNGSLAPSIVAMTFVLCVPT